MNIWIRTGRQRSICACACKSAEQEGMYEFILVTGEIERSDPQLAQEENQAASVHIRDDRNYLFGSQ